MGLTQWKTSHFWLGLLATGCVGALGILVMLGSHHVIVMAALALAIVLFQQMGITTAAAWLPPNVQTKLSQQDLQNYIAGGSSALSQMLGKSTSATEPTTVIVAENAVVTK